MKYKVLKRVTRNYDEKFSREKQTDEMHINVRGIGIIITEQQCGHSLSEPHITIYAPNGCVYEMDFNTFINKVTSL